MRGAWPFQLRLEAPVHQPMHRLVGHLFTPLSGQPVLDLTLATESLGLLQPRLQRRKRRGRHRALFGRGTAGTHPQQSL